MMHTTCMNPSPSLIRCRRPSLSLHFDTISPLFPCSCCCCCCCCCCAANNNNNNNSVYNTLPRIIINPSFLCNGLRQSTLIRFSPSKRLIVNGRRRHLCNSNSNSNSNSRVSSCSDDSDGRYYYYYYKKLYCFNERKKLGGGRKACNERRAFSNETEDDCVDEVELLLDLLSEEVGLESISVRDRKRIQKKDSSKIISGRTKTVKSGYVEKDLKCDTRVVEVRSGEKENRKLSNERATVIGVDHERKKQGSSCSSYYSVSSAGEYESDNDVVIEDNDYFVEGESLSEYKDDWKTDGYKSRVYEEEFGEKQGEMLKKSRDESHDRNQEWRKKSEKKLNVESSQSQHTEKDSQRYSEKNDGIIDQSQSGMKSKKSSSQKLYSDTENKLITSLQEQTSHHKTETDDFTRRNDYKKQSNVISEASEIHNFDKRMASSSSSSFETRMKNWEDHSTQVSGRFEEQREEKHRRVDQLASSKESRIKQREEKHLRVDQLASSKESRMKSQQISEISDTQSDIRIKKQQLHDQRDEKHQRVDQLASSKESRVKSQQISEISDTQSDIRIKKQELHDQREEKHQRVDQLASSKESRVKSQQISDTLITNIENTSVSHRQSDTRTKKQELHLESSSTSEKRKNIENKYSSQVAVVVGPTESMKAGRKTTKASSFHVGMPKEASSSYKALKLNPESSFQQTGANITSADEQQKSAGQIVGEFVEKAKHQLSVSEGELAFEEQHELKSSGESGSGTFEDQHELKSSGESGSGNNDEKVGDMGPSDEMWHESGAPVNTSSEEQVKRSGRSLWNVIGDVIRLRWGPSRSETHTPKSSGVSNQSTSSERWFSGREPDDSSRKDVSTPSSFKEKQDSPLLLSSSKSMSPLVIEESSILLPAIRMRRSPVVKTTSVTGEPDASTMGKVDQIVSKPLTQVTHMDASDSGKMVIVEPPIPSRRKLARIDQVSKDRFDEWEEAYTIEAKQRKNDEFFMREALSEARKAADLWEVPVGAVLVQDGKIIARGYNLVEELRDSTAHAEMVCIREASNKLHSWRLSGTTLYVTLEPCPMCAGAILQARIDAVVWGAPNKLLGADGSWIRLFPDGEGSGNGSDKPPAPVHPFHPNMTVRRGVLSSECADVMQQFFQLRRKKKDKKPEAEPPSPPPPSCLPIAHHHNSKLVTKLHDAFNIMFCL